MNSPLLNQFCLIEKIKEITNDLQDSTALIENALDESHCCYTRDIFIHGCMALLQAKAYLLNPANINEEIIFDFKDVKVLAPSWADEFIPQVIAFYKGQKVLYENTENPSVKETLAILEN